MGSLRRLVPYLTRHWLPFWGGISGLLLARLFEAFIPLLLMRAIDSIAAGDPALLLPVLGIVGCAVGRFGTIVVSRRRIRYLGIHVAYDLRRRMYDHLQQQGPAFFARHGTGDLMARAVNDIQLVRQLVGQGTRTVLVLGFSALVGLSFMFYQSFALTLLLLLPLPLVGVAGYVLARRIYAQSIAVQEGFSELSDRTQENLNGIRTVQAQGQEAQEILRFGEVNQGYADRYLELMRTNALMSSIMPGLATLSFLVVLGYGGSRVLSGELSVGTFTSFFWYIGMVLWPVREAGNMVNLFQRGAAACTRLFEILDSEPEIADRPLPGAPEKLAGAIEVRDLSYRYPRAAVDALQSVSFSIEPGETLALVGPIGSGKSTLLRLLVRLLEPAPGAVRLDGYDVRDLPLELVRREVAAVPQDPFLFAESLRQNVAYENPRRDGRQVWRAIEDASLRESVESFPARLDTIVGERGVTLSGGQKQRTTLARGLIRVAPVLLLDDCFSSVDTETEKHILDRLRELRRDATTVIVSHRVSTVRHADRILVLQHGRVTESGSHAELVARGGFYAALERAQRRRGQLLEELVAASIEGHA